MSIIQIIFVGFITFCLILVQCAANSSNIVYVNEEAREKGIAACCPQPWAECCRQNLSKNDPINCTGLPYQEAFAIGICLEKHFYGAESEMEFRYHNCCWLLSGEDCNGNCYHNLRAPTLPPSKKWYFSKVCPEMTLNATVNITELDCLRDRGHVLHTCFRTCLHWQKQHRAKGNAALPEDRFCPELDCPDYAQLMASDDCFIPIHYSGLFRGPTKMKDCAVELKEKRKMVENEKN